MRKIRSDEPSLRDITDAELEAVARAVHARLNHHQSWDDYDARRAEWRNGMPHESQIIAVSVARIAIEALQNVRKDGSSPMKTETAHDPE